MYTQELGLTEKLAVVDNILLLKGGVNDSKFTLVPDNNAEIILPLEGRLLFQCIGSVRPQYFLAERGYFLLPRRRGARIELLPNSSCLIVKVNPILTRKIASGLSEFANGTFDLNLNADQRDALIATIEKGDRFMVSDLLEDFFGHIPDLHDYNMTILNAIEQIRDSCGTTSVKEVYSNLNVSKSKLEQHFNREIGLTPKEFCKIQKINCFINSYMEDNNLNLTELTYQCGYYDQSHLIKDFKYFMNTSPRKFFENYSSSDC